VQVWLRNEHAVEAVEVYDNTPVDNSDKGPDHT
jgi:hypothetical protein